MPATVVNFFGMEFGGLTDFYNLSGSPSATTGLTGDYALLCDPTTTGARYAAAGIYDAGGLPAVYDIDTAYYSFKLKITTLPGSGSEELFAAWTAASAYKFALRVTSTGKLQAYASDGTTQLGSDGSTTLVADTVYQIDVKVGTGAAAGAYEVKIGGSVELSGTGNLTDTNNGLSCYGKVTDRNGQTVAFVYDDIVIASGDYPTAGQVLGLLPVADGAYTAWTIGAGEGEKFEQIDERPNDGDTSYLLSTQTATQAYTAALTNTSTAGITGTVYAVKSNLIVKRSGSGASMIARFRSGTTDTDTAGFTPASTYQNRAYVKTTDPATSAAWTLAGVDGVEIGGVENSATQTSRLTQAVLQVYFTASTESSSVSPSVSPSSSVSVSSSPSLSPSSSISPSVSPSVSASIAKAFGEQNPTAGEDPVSWQTWSDGAGGTPTVTGDADWGKLTLDLSGEEGRSLVYDLGSAIARKFTLTENRYGTGDENAVLQIRGSVTSFTQDAAVPVWEEYTAAITRTWRYVQVGETTLSTFDQSSGAVAVEA